MEKRNIRDNWIIDSFLNIQRDSIINSFPRSFQISFNSFDHLFAIKLFHFHPLIIFITLFVTNNHVNSVNRMYAGMKWLASNSEIACKFFFLPFRKSLLLDSRRITPCASGETPFGRIASLSTPRVRSNAYAYVCTSFTVNYQWWIARKRRPAFTAVGKK